MHRRIVKGTAFRLLLAFHGVDGQLANPGTAQMHVQLPTGLLDPSPPPIVSAGSTGNYTWDYATADKPTGMYTAQIESTGAVAVVQELVFEVVPPRVEVP